MATITLPDALAYVGGEKIIKAAMAAENKGRKKDQEPVLRDAIAPGTYDVDATLRILGRVTVGDDYDQRIVQSMCPLRLLAVALNKLNGVSVESLVEEALSTDPKELPEGVLGENEIKARVAAAMEALKGTTVKSCKGKITVKGAEVLALEAE